MFVPTPLLLSALGAGGDGVLVSVVEVSVLAASVSSQLIGELGLSVTRRTLDYKVCVLASEMFPLQSARYSPTSVLLTRRAVVSWCSMGCLPFRSPCLPDELTLGTVGAHRPRVLSTAMLSSEPRWVIDVLHLLGPRLPG